MRSTPSLVLVLACAVLLGGAASGQEAEKKDYACPPCGAECDKHVQDAPGDCPACGMQLVERAAFVQAVDNPVSHGGAGYRCPMPGHMEVYAKPGLCPICAMKLVDAETLAKTRKSVAILLFDGVQIIDYTGPYEVFGQAQFDVFTVADGPGPITTAMGMSVNPRYELASCPKADVLVIPGGGVNPHLENGKVLQWIRDRSQQAEVVLSVCNGAFFLAKAGLLDGLEATTFAGLIDELSALATKTKVVRDKRFVDNGKIVTTAGLSSGIEGSLHVVEKLRGKGWAQRIALNLEYHWQPELNWVRAALPDRYIVVETPPELDFEPLLTEGATDHWEKRWSLRTEHSAGELFDLINQVLATSNKWSRQAAEAPGGDAESAWRFTDEQGRSWAAVARVEAADAGRLTLSIRIQLATS